MSAPALRPYQSDCVAALRASFAGGHRAPLLALPTGAGKTVIFSEVTRRARAKGRRVLVVVHRRELLHQASAKLAWAGVPHGVIAAGFDAAPAEQVQVGSVQTLVRQLDGLLPFDLIVLDEAHHCRAAMWRSLLKGQPAAKLLGVTATPARLDGKGLGVQAGGPFDDLVAGSDIAELVAVGFLSPARCFVPEQRLDLRGVRVRAGDYVPSELASVVDRAGITGDAVEQYRRRADHQPALAFCATVAHAENVAGCFRAAGYRSQCVHGKTPAAERDVLIAGLGNGAIEILTSCDLISEGLDAPALGAVILLRPTKSLVLHMQQIGRGMRPAPGKAELIVLDHVANVLVHGLPDAKRAWTLAGGAEKNREAPEVRMCPGCGCCNPIGARACSSCGYVRPAAEPRPRLLQHVPGDLSELSAARLARVRRLSYRQILRLRLSEAELREFARVRGYKRGWVAHWLREQAGSAANG